jgi:hypothetical protein
MSLLKLWFIRNPVLVSYSICVRQGGSNLSGSQSALTYLCVCARAQLGLREFNILQANSRAIDTHLGGGTLGHLGLIISDASYAMITPTMDAGPTLWISPQAPGPAPANTDGTAAQISAARHVWEEDVQTYHTYTSVQQALKKQIISVFEPMYFDVLNYNMVGFANISAIYMLDNLFSTYDNITAVDLEINFEHMRREWDPQQPVESLFKQIQDCADYSEAGGVLIGHPQQINVGYAKIFATGHFMSACLRWNEKHLIEKTWTQFKSQFASAHRQHEQMQGESAATAGYHSVNAAVGQTEDQLAEATIGPLATLPRLLRRIEALWQLSQRPTHVLSSSSRITQTSYGNSRH